MKKTLFYTLCILLMGSLTACHHKKLTKEQKDGLEDVYNSLKDGMPEATVTLNGDRVKVVLPESVLFDKNSAELNSSYLPILGKMAVVLNKYPKTSILISGYTDISGTDALNMDLSKRRAQSAKQIFVKDNVSASRMYTWGRGSKDPIADNKTEAGMAQNRRVEYVIMYDYKPNQK